MNKRVLLIMAVSLIGVLLLAGQVMSKSSDAVSPSRAAKLELHAGDIVDFSKIDQCDVLKDSLKTSGRIEGKVKSFTVSKIKLSGAVCGFEFDTGIADCEIDGNVVHMKNDEKIYSVLNICNAIQSGFIAGKEMIMHYDSNLGSGVPMLRIKRVKILKD